MKLTSNHTAPLTHNQATAGAAAFALLLSAAVFAPLLGAYFRGDDFMHLFHLANYDLLTNLVIPHGGHVLAVRNFIFFLCWRAFGMEPLGYYTLAVFTHLVNVALLFAVIHRLTGSNVLAAFGAPLWGHLSGAGRRARVVLGVRPRAGRHGTAGAPLSDRRICPGRTNAEARSPVDLVRDRDRRHDVLRGRTRRRARAAIRHRLRLPGTVPLVAAAVAVAGCAGETAWGISIGIASGVAVALLLAAGAVAVRDCRARPTLLACGLLTAAVYGIIATARGFFFLERPDLLHMATRHQYAALIPVTIAVCVALQSARRGVLPCRAACRPQSCCCGPSAR